MELGQQLRLERADVPTSVASPERFPVDFLTVEGGRPGILLVLHGGGGGEGNLESVAPLLEALAGEVSLVAAPLSGRTFFMDYRDGSQLWETALIEDVIPWARAQAGPNAPIALLGVSMGGLAALRLAFKHPELFSSVAAVCPGIEPVLDFDDIVFEDRFFRGDAFFEGIFGKPVDRAYWRRNHPAAIVLDDLTRLRELWPSVYIECGDRDSLGLFRGAEFLHRLLTDHSLPHEYHLVLGADHVGSALPRRLREALGFVSRTIHGLEEEPEAPALREHVALVRAQALRDSPRQVAGWVAPGFEPVRDTFEATAGGLGEGGGAFAAYVDGKPVADLWAGEARPGRPWTADTLGILASITKGLTGFCVQMLADQGLLDPDRGVAEYWPEFAQAGKDGVLVRDVLLHTAGVLSAPELFDLLGYDGTGWDRWDDITAALAAAAPAWEPGKVHGYHALSYGWLAGELVRRVSGRSVGRFFAQEVAAPLGLDVYISTPVTMQHRVAWAIYHSPDELTPTLAEAWARLLAEARNPETLTGKALLGKGESGILDPGPGIMRNPRFLAAEVPSSSGTGTARSLARLYALLAMGGEIDGIRLVSEDSIERFGSVALQERDVVMAPGVENPPPVSRTLGYMGNPAVAGLPRPYGPSASTFGSSGLGGQQVFADPERRVSAAFVRSHFSELRAVSRPLVDALYDCLD